MSHVSHSHQHHAEPGLATDPVCGMSVDPHTTPHRHTHQGHPYYFCSAGCRTKFVAEPQKYLGSREPERVTEGAIYTCPMHPQIRQPGPGACPICGMGLELELVTAESGPNPELADMTRRFWIGLALAVPVMIVEMSGHFGAHWFAPATSNLIQFVVRDAGRRVGRLAVLPARRAIAGHAQSQHVHADRDGHRRGLRLQPRRHVCSRYLSRMHSGCMAARPPSISRPPA